MSRSYSRQTTPPRKPVRVRCARTGKVAYKTHDKAMLMAADIMAKPDCNTRQFRAYRCGFCDHWHLTSK